MFVVYYCKMPTITILSVTPCPLYTRRDNLGDSAPHLNAAVATKTLTLYVAKDRDINRGTYRVYHSFKGLESTNYREHMLYGVCNCGQLNK